MDYHTDSWVAETHWLIEEGTFDVAAERIELALGERQDDPELLNLKGLLLHHKGLKNEANGYFKRALDAGPKSGRLRAAILGNLRHPKEALQVIETYLAEHPNDPLARENKAATLTQLNYHALAIDCFNKALLLNPTDLYAYKYKTVCIKFLKNQFATLVCWVCCRQFQGDGFEPIPYWEVPTELCAQCYKQYLACSKTRHVMCIDRLLNPSTSIEGVLFAFSQGSSNKIVFEPTHRDALPTIIQNDIISCRAVEQGPTLGEYVPIDTETNNAQYIQLDYMREGTIHSLIFNVKKEYAIMLSFMQAIAQNLKV